MLKNSFVICLSMCSLMLLSSCGGGGGGGGAAPGISGNPVVTAPPIIQPPSCSGLVPTSVASVTVQGNVKYEKVGSLASGALDYGSISQQPIKGATVELMYGCVVAATTQSSMTGQYTFSSVPGSVTFTVRVRAELKQTTGAAQWDVSVSDNTNSNAMYVLQSANFNSGSGRVQDLLAGSGWAGSSYTGTRAAGPFAILDVIYASQQKVLAINPSTIFPNLRAFWSINNSSASGDLTLGNIGSSFFRELTVTSGIVRELYILGRQNDDTDEYDSSVVAHEWGHYYQSAFSRDDSTGGRHGGSDDRLDRRIAFSEGWGNAWSGMVLAQNTYRDSFGPTQASGFFLPLNSGHAGATPKGWFREQSLQFVLWDLHRQAGFAPIHSALTNSGFKTGVALSDIHSFSASLRSSASSTVTAALNSLLSAESISSNSDALGSNESNNGGIADALPYYRSITILGSPVSLAAGQSMCVSSAFDAGNAGNKLGRFVYATFSTPSAGPRTITVSSNNPLSDTDFEVHSSGQMLTRADVGVSSSESASVNLNAGQHVLLIYDYNNAAGNNCFTVSIQ
jgi:hypothetical protein